MGEPCVRGTTALACGSGLVCDPIMLRCFKTARSKASFCTTKADCGPGLYCDTYTRRCRYPNNLRGTCHEPDLPCNSTAGNPLSCETIRNQCFSWPRQADQPCVDSSECAPGLGCELVVSNECQANEVTAGKICHATRPCGPNFSCHPAINKCYDVPRCVARQPSMPALACPSLRWAQLPTPQPCPPPHAQEG